MGQSRRLRQARAQGKIIGSPNPVNQAAPLPTDLELIKACMNPSILLRGMPEADRRAFDNLNNTCDCFAFRIKIQTVSGPQFVTLHVGGDMVMAELEPHGAEPHRYHNRAPG